jgi:hypothetical protein
MAMKWEITSGKVQKVIGKIVEISNPRKLILLGISISIATLIY